MKVTNMMNSAQAGALIKTFREAKNWTQPKLANNIRAWSKKNLPEQRLTVSPVSISRWEHGLRPIPADYWEALVGCLCVGDETGKKDLLALLEASRSSVDARVGPLRTALRILPLQYPAVLASVTKPDESEKETAFAFAFLAKLLEMANIDPVIASAYKSKPLNGVIQEIETT